MTRRGDALDLRPQEPDRTGAPTTMTRDLIVTEHMTLDG